MMHPLALHCSVAVALTMLASPMVAQAQSPPAFPAGYAVQPAASRAFEDPRSAMMALPPDTGILYGPAAEILSSAVEDVVTAEFTRVVTGAVAAAGARGQDESGAGLPGIASFHSASSPSSVPLVAVVSFVSLIMGLALMFMRTPATAQLAPRHPESGLHRAQRAAALATGWSTRI